MGKKTKDELIRAIETAFATTPYPGDDNIGQSHEIDSVTKAFKGKSWRDVSMKLAFDYRGELSYFTPNAFRFYLPGFMIAVLQHPEAVDTLPTNLILRLTPPEAFEDRWPRATIDRMTQNFLTNSDLYTPEEVKAIGDFLEFYAKSSLDDFETSQLKFIDKAIAFWRWKNS